MGLWDCCTTEEEESSLETIPKANIPQSKNRHKSHLRFPLAILIPVQTSMFDTDSRPPKRYPISYLKNVPIRHKARGASYSSVSDMDPNSSSWLPSWPEWSARRAAIKELQWRERMKRLEFFNPPESSRG
ncbi:hypothetical protein CEXT_324511 [Caerostris extrusa]|uniref:Uncharacterized protein n=1 Tax=Caerostris extrusa TaxID=172846 RepID=A0AAV4P1C3_CAEEX|nr:hypothetical protein CEXT_324511 [Caerostris extrusa]